MYSIVMLSAMSAGADVVPPSPIGGAPFNAMPGALIAHGTGMAPVGWYGYYYGASIHGAGGPTTASTRGGVFTSGTPYSTRYIHPTDYGHPSHYAYPSAHAFPFGYSCAGTCHGGAMVVYGSAWGPGIGMPPYPPLGYHTGLAPVWGSGAPVVFGALADPNSAPMMTDPTPPPLTDPNPPPVMTVPVAPPPRIQPGSDK